MSISGEKRHADRGMSAYPGTAMQPPPPGSAPPDVAAAAAAAPPTMEEALAKCEEEQPFIELNSGHLERLRAPGKNVTSELTKQEIRTLEGKLIKQFSRQLAIRTAATAASSPSSGSAALQELQKYPSLSKWLVVVGISSESKKAILSRIMSLEQLKERTESELNRLLLSATRLTALQRNEDLRRLSRSLQSLKQYTAILRQEGGSPGRLPPDATKMDLHWDSWQSAAAAAAATAIAKTPSTDSPKEEPSSSAATGGSVPVPVASHSARPYSGGRVIESAASSLSSTSSAASSLPPPSPGIAGMGPQYSSPQMSHWQQQQQHASPCSPSSSASAASAVPPGGGKCMSTPPTTPPWTTTMFGMSAAKKDKFPTTPPPNKKHRTVGGASAAAVAASVAKANQQQGKKMSASDYPLTKSKSHECELGNRIVPAGVTVVDIGGGGANICSTSSASSRAGSATAAEMRSPPNSAGPSSGGDATFPLPAARRRPLHSEPAVDDDPSAGLSQHPVISPSPFDSSSGGGDGANGAGSSSASSSTQSAPQSTLPIPKSPCTPRSMGHTITHRFKKTLKPARCDHCSEYMFNGKLYVVDSLPTHKSVTQNFLVLRT